MTDVTHQDRFYTLQEVSAQCGLIPYIVRYWQGHFPQLGSGAGKTQYTVNDVALLRRIKKLLYGEHLTIEQAKERLSRERAFPVQYPGGVDVRPTQSVQPQPVQQEKPQPVQQAQQPPQQAAAVPTTATQSAAETQAIAAALAEVRGQLDAARQAAARSEAQQAQWTQTEQQLKSENESLKMRAAALAAQLEQALSRSKADEAALEAERSQKVALAAELESAKNKVQTLANELAAGKQELEIRTGELAAARAEADDLKAQLEQFTMQAGQSAEIFDSLHNRNAELEQKLAFTLQQLKSIAGLFGKNL